MRKKLHIIISVGIASLILCSGCTSMAQSGAISGAQRSMDKGDYQSALSHLARGEGYKEPKPEVGAKIGYMKALCYEGLRKPDEARTMFQFVAEHFSDTQYGYLAKQRLKNI